MQSFSLHMAVDADSSTVLDGLYNSSSSLSNTRANNQEAVRAEFAAANFPVKLVDHILQRYPPYLSRDAASKLRPAIQAWQQDLGSHELCCRLRSRPDWLAGSLAQTQATRSWFLGLGVQMYPRSRRQILEYFIQVLQNAIQRLNGCSKLGSRRWLYVAI